MRLVVTSHVLGISVLSARVYQIIIIAVISIAPYFTNNSECTALYKINKNAYSETSKIIICHSIVSLHTPPTHVHTYTHTHIYTHTYTHTHTHTYTLSSNHQKQQIKKGKEKTKESFQISQTKSKHFQQ